MKKKKTNLILDLDNTLISSQEYNTFQKNNKMEKFIYTVMDTEYIVFHRPHLDTFLDFVFKNFNVSVWTAGTKDYALFIIKHIILSKKNRKLDYILSRFNCNESEFKFGEIKDLNMFHFDKNYNKENTIIIDDNEDVIKQNKNNSIQVKPFEYTDRSSYTDKELLKVIQILEISFL